MAYDEPYLPTEKGVLPTFQSFAGDFIYTIKAGNVLIFFEFEGALFL